MHTAGNPRRAFRYEDHDRWAQFLTLAGDKKASDVLRGFVDWYTHKPGAKMPRRPNPDQPGPAD